MSEKANNSYSTRTTTDKTVTGAINELNANKPTVETGAFTPYIKGATTAGSNTYAVQVGRYIKEGKKITCWFRIIMTVKDPSMLGNILIGGLPYVALNNNANRAGLSISGVSYFTISSGYSGIMGTSTPNDSAISLYAYGNNVAHVAPTEANINANSQIYGSITYETSV